MLDKIRIRSAHVYVGPRTGTKAGDRTALAPGPTTAQDGAAFVTMSGGWKPSPLRRQWQRRRRQWS